MSHDSESVFIPAKKAAIRYGFEPLSKSGRHGNHTQFLARLAEHHADFPPVRWIGGRKVFKLAELETFERALPRARASKPVAA
jgi:hypothetical protein